MYFGVEIWGFHITRRYNKVISCFCLSLKSMKKPQLQLSSDTGVLWLTEFSDMNFTNGEKLVVQFQTKQHNSPSIYKVVYS